MEPRFIGSHCRCGWARPLIALTTIDGTEKPPPGIVPAYACPECGALHIAGEVSEADAARILSELGAALNAALRAGLRS